MQSTLTTESVPPRQRAEYWEAMVSQQFVPANCVPATRSAFSAEIRTRDLAAIQLCDVRSHGTDVLRTPAHISRADTGYFLVSLQMEGTGRLVQAGRSVVLQPGDMALYDTTRAYELRFAAAQRQLVLRIPRASLLARDASAESRVGIGIPHETPAAWLAADLARSLAALDSLPSESAQSSLASTLMELVLDGLGTARKQPSDGPDAHRLLQARRMARRHLTDSSFSVARWADAMGISERYLRLLFGRSAESPAQYLWGQRLEWAAGKLCDPACASRSITEIALACGFNDSAHFSRAFRIRFGASPSQYRLARSADHSPQQLDRAFD